MASRKKKIAHPHIEALIQHFGGAEELSLALKRHKLPRITEDGISKWRRRGTISMQRLIDLQKLSVAENKPIDIGVYFTQLATR